MLIAVIMLGVCVLLIILLIVISDICKDKTKELERLNAQSNETGNKVSEDVQSIIQSVVNSRCNWKRCKKAPNTYKNKTTGVKFSDGKGYLSRSILEPYERETPSIIAPYERETDGADRIALSKCAKLIQARDMRDASCGEIEHYPCYGLSGQWLVRDIIDGSEE